MQQRPGQQTIQDIPGPYNAKIHGSPYAVIPPEPIVKHDPLTGPYGYFKNSCSTIPSSQGGNHPHSFASNSKLGSSRPYPPSEFSAYPPTVYPPPSSTNEPYQRTESSASNQHTESLCSSSDGSSHGRFHPVTPSLSTEYTGSIYVQSPYGHGLPRPSPPPHLTVSSHLGSASMSVPSTAHPPLGHHNPSYPSGPGAKPSQFEFDNLAGNFVSLELAGNESESSSHGSYPGYHSTQSLSDNKPPAGYHPLESISGNYPRDDPSNGRLASGYPPPGYPTPGYLSPCDSSHGEYPWLGSDSLYGYQAPPLSLYPQQLGVHQQLYGRVDVDNASPPFQHSYPPAPYYEAPPAHYVPAGYPK